MYKTVKCLKFTVNHTVLGKKCLYIFAVPVVRTNHNAGKNLTNAFDGPLFSRTLHRSQSSTIRSMFIMLISQYKVVRCYENFHGKPIDVRPCTSFDFPITTYATAFNLHRWFLCLCCFGSYLKSVCEIVNEMRLSYLASFDA